MHTCKKLSEHFTLQPLRAVGVLFSPMVSGWAGGKKFVQAVSRGATEQSTLAERGKFHENFIPIFRAVTGTKKRHRVLAL